MNDDQPQTVAWIDYLLASDDPIDLGLSREFAEAWLDNLAMNEEIRVNPVTADLLALIERRQAETQALYLKVAVRGRELQAVGSAPAPAGTFDAWIEAIANSPPLS